MTPIGIGRQPPPHTGDRWPSVDISKTTETAGVEYTELSQIGTSLKMKFTGGATWTAKSERAGGQSLSS
ncbi:hypothetical protein VTN49DRAFT_5493 [Thermomyces lanuginosus]|uniref:uncharacterized protein n=1 Tax=Thermomyces lanuginosus TaxID=5541 RepID=UPI0037423EE8